MDSSRASAFEMTLKCTCPSSEIPPIAPSASTSQGSDVAGKGHSFLGNFSQHPTVIAVFAFWRLIKHKNIESKSDLAQLGAL